MADKISDGGRAFPVPDEGQGWGSAGMSLLEHYAGQALPAATERALRHAAENGLPIDGGIPELIEGIAKASFDIAEAMVAEALKRRG